jgi:two-component system NarL family response regulator
VLQQGLPGARQPLLAVTSCFTASRRKCGEILSFLSREPQKMVTIQHINFVPELIHSDMQFNWLSIILGINSLIWVYLAGTVWRQRSIVGARYLAAYLLSIASSSLFYGLMLMSADLPFQIAWYNLRSLGDLTLGPAYVIFVLWYTGYGRLLKRAWIAGFFGVAILTYLMLLTNDWHHLNMSQVWVQPYGGLFFLGRVIGPLNVWVVLVICFPPIVGLVLLTRHVLRMPRSYFRQFWLVYVGALLPSLVHIAYLWGWRPYGDLIPTYFAWGLTGIFLMVGLIRFRLLELHPVARETVMEKVPVGILVLNSAGRVVDINPAARSDLGIPADADLVRPFREVRPELMDWLEGKLPIGDDLQEICEFEFSGLPGKRTYAVEITALRDGTARNGWVVLLRNVTEQVETQDRLEEREEKLRFIAENVGSVLFEASPEYELTYVSSYIHTLIGCTSAEILHLPIFAFLSAPSNEYLRSMLAEVQLELRNGKWAKYLDRIDTFELNLVHRDGHTISAETQVAYQFSPEHELIGIIGVVRDISERKLLESHKLEEQRALAALNEREQLARELHDNLGQVMSTINIQAQTVLGYMRDGMDELAQAGLQSLADLARVSHADLRELLLGLRQELQGTRDFYSALEKYLADFTHLYNLPVQVVLPPPETRRAFDPVVEVQLLRVIQEGLSNIRRHAQASQALVYFTVSDHETNLVIEDNGIGYSPEKADHDSEPGHFGMGIMRERIAAVGGTLQIISAPGRGTRIVIGIPSCDNLPDRTEIGSLRVVIADDHPMFRDGLRNLLVARGIKVVGVAKDGQEAVALAVAQRPDIAILDIQMPVLDGVEAVRQIKLQAPEVRLLVLTMAADEETLFKAIRAGASGYLLKDLKAEEFLDRLEGLIRGETPISPGLAEKLLKEFASAPEPVENYLTARQQEILRLMAQRLTYAQIASRLFLTESAVKYHVTQIMSRLHAASRGDILAEAARRGWIDRRDSHSARQPT